MQHNHPRQRNSGSFHNELNIRVLKPLATFVLEKHGVEVQERIAAAAGLKRSDLDGRSCWVTLEQFEAVLAGARQLVDSDEAFLEACVYGFKQEPVWLLMAATSPQDALPRLNRLARSAVSHISSFDAIREGRLWTVRYRSERKESHLMCISRQAQMRELPTLWGMRRARVTMPKCIARGDDCCEYQFVLFENRRWLPAAIGALAGVCIAAAISLLLSTGPWPFVMLPLLGLLMGSQYELLRTHRVNQIYERELQEGIEKTVREEADARRELLAFHERQKSWVKQMDEQLVERTAALDRVLQQVRQIQEARLVNLRGWSHDIRNPLSVLKSSLVVLEEHAEALDEDADVVQEMATAIQAMNRLLSGLMETAAAEHPGTPFVPQELKTDVLVDRIRRRTRALVYGRDVRASTVRTSDAPDSIVVDELLFDRVIDNLLTNAAKYTEHGDIDVELGGTPGFLTIRISDTGRGIDPESLSSVFQPAGSNEQTRAPASYGVGLSVVVQLLALAGGKLEVSSNPGEGTTFWVHFPERNQRHSATVPKKLPPHRESQEELVSRVVSFHRQLSA